MGVETTFGFSNFFGYFLNSILIDPLCMLRLIQTIVSINY